jgi:hypothetical protein
VRTNRRTHTKINTSGDAQRALAKLAEKRDKESVKQRVLPQRACNARTTIYMDSPYAEKLMQQVNSVNNSKNSRRNGNMTTHPSSDNTVGGKTSKSGVVFKSGQRNYVRMTKNALVIKENYKRRLCGHRNSFFEPLRNKWLSVYDRELLEYTMIANRDLTNTQMKSLGPITALVEVLRERGIPFKGIAVANKSKNRYAAILPKGERRIYVGEGIETGIMKREASKWGVEPQDYVERTFNKLTLEYLPVSEVITTRKKKAVTAQV